MKKLDIALLVIIVPLFCWGGYWVIKTFGLLATILLGVLLVGSCFMNERHNPIVLYYKNSGKIHKIEDDVNRK